MCSRDVIKFDIERTVLQWRSLPRPESHCIQVRWRLNNFKKLLEALENPSLEEDVVW